MSCLKPPSPFPTSPLHLPHSRLPSLATPIRFSRWNNANAEPFRRRQRDQQQIESDLRLHRRHHSASQIIASDTDTSTATPPPTQNIKSRGTPSRPSPPSIPGKSSKYSKPPKPPKPASHPAFRRVTHASITRNTHASPSTHGSVAITDQGVAYRLPGAPFEFQYSYTESPKVKPLGLREPGFLPFGPSTMPRPWTGRAPLPKSKKQLPEFDSFRLPPPGKKGVKPVQSPGPFVAGSGPRYGMRTREEVLGEELGEEEVKELVKGSLRVRRLLNIGRDGLTHNMLENIHSHWKRRRVCKIKCIGVCTVDMDNVRKQLEEKTGGKIIYNRGGVIFLFRGRNYNYKTRPRYPLMLWKPVAAVYPRLVPKVPEGLTPQEAIEMRKKGHKLPPICKIGKNGLYSNLVQHVREAFEECELVRINCTGLNKSDYKKIGAKLQDLVPCVLLSFAYEHILMWRGKDWKSSLPSVEDDHKQDGEAIASGPETISQRTADSLTSNQEVLESGAEDYYDDLNLEPPMENTSDQELLESGAEHYSNDLNLETPLENTRLIEDVHEREYGDPCTVTDKVDDKDSLVVLHLETPGSYVGKGSEEDSPLATPCESFSRIKALDLESKDLVHPEGELELLPDSLVGLTQIETNESISRTDIINDTNESDMILAETSQCKSSINCSACLDGVMLLMRQAVDSGSAVILDDDSLDANIVYQRSVALAKMAPPGPAFKHRTRKTVVKKVKIEKGEKYEEQLVDAEVVTVSEKTGNGRKRSSHRREDFRVIPSDVVPHGTLGVDELAKLLA